MRRLSVIVVLICFVLMSSVVYCAPSGSGGSKSKTEDSKKKEDDKEKKKEDSKKEDNKKDNKEDSKKESSGNSSGSYKLKNDGKEKKEPFEDSGLPSSFKEAKYYDCAIPYQLTADDVGGWATSVEGTNSYHGMTDDVRTTRKIGWMCTWEGDCSWFGGHGAQPQGLTWSYEEDTGIRMVTDKNGTQYYVCAIQGWQYSNSIAGTDGFFTFGTNVGSCFEIILTDGTVIRFMVGDNNGNGHTNGGIGDTQQGQWTACAADGLWHFAPMKMKQYQNLFTGSATSHIELWGSSGAVCNNFLNKYNFGNEDDKNKIAYYRIYNFNLHDPREPVNDKVKPVTYKIGVNGIESSSDSEVVELSVQEGLFSETHFVKWKVMEVPTVHTGVRMISDDNVMHENDIHDIENWKSDLEKQRGDGLLIKGGRWVAILLGIVFEIWMMFMYLAYWFDRLNNFFDFSLLYVVSLGRLRISPDETECNFSVKSLAKGEVRTINHKKLLGVVITGLAFGSIIISGLLFTWLHNFVNLVLKFVG